MNCSRIPAALLLGFTVAAGALTITACQKTPTQSVVSQRSDSRSADTAAVAALTAAPVPTPTPSINQTCVYKVVTASGADCAGLNPDDRVCLPCHVADGGGEACRDDLDCDVEFVPRSPCELRLREVRRDRVPECNRCPATATFIVASSKCRVPKEPGACCLDGSRYCRDDVTQGECKDDSGEYLGVGTRCIGRDGASPCASEIAGACCIKGSCVIATRQGCEDERGQFRGPESRCPAGTGNPCTGACCVHGNCAQLDAQQCASDGGSFHAWERCSDVNCNR